MCVYLSKTEDECSQAMSEAVKESLEANFSNYEQMHSIAQAYSSKRECSLQEEVYHIMPELWLRKFFPAVIFDNRNLPENRYRVCLSEAELKELPQDSSDILKKNMLDRYMNQPDVSFASGKYAIVDQMCFAEFLRYCSLRNCHHNSDSQPIELTEELLEESLPSSDLYPKVLPIMGSKENLYCRKFPFVLRYHVPNKYKYPEKYAYHLLILFYPFLKEFELNSRNNLTYTEKLFDNEVLDIVNFNKAQIEPYGELVDSAFSQFRSDFNHNIDSFAQKENDEVIEQEGENNPSFEEQDKSNVESSTESSAVDFSIANSENILADEDINQK